MNKPKFNVGEVVILMSKETPQFNGEYEVLNIKLFKQAVISGRVYDSIYGYDLGLDCRYAEGSLRKKHRPGTQSFTDLMSSLKSPKIVSEWDKG